MSQEVVIIETKTRRQTPEIIDLGCTPQPKRRRRMPKPNNEGVQIIGESRSEVQILRTVRRLPTPIVRIPKQPTIVPQQPTLEPPMQPAMLKCTICLDLASETTSLCSTVCGHIFCVDCLEGALKVDKKCPNCRKKLKKGQYHRIYLSV